MASMDPVSGNVQPVCKFDNDDVIFVVDEEERQVHVGEILNVDVKEDESLPLVPEISIRWWLSNPPQRLYDPYPPENESAAAANERLAKLQLSDRVLQAGDSVTHLHQPGKKGIVLGMRRRCDLEIVDRNQFLRDVDCRRLITNPRADPPRRVLHRGWVGLAKVKASSAVLRFLDGARLICPGAVVNKFVPMTVGQRRQEEEDPITVHDALVEGMVLRGDIGLFANCRRCKFLTTTASNNPLMLSLLSKEVETEVTIEKVITKGLLVDWLWNLIGSNDAKHRPPRVFMGKEMKKLTFLDHLDDVWYWGCRYDTLWSYEVQPDDVIIDNNCHKLSRESLFYELYVNESPTFGCADTFHESVKAGVEPDNDNPRTLYRYTVPDAQQRDTAPPAVLSQRITARLGALMDGSLRQRLRRSRKARQAGREVDITPVRKAYEAEAVYRFSWRPETKVAAGQRVAVTVVRSESLADVLWADGSVETDLPMTTFGFELYEDYMQAPQFMPGDLILAADAPHPTGPALQQTDWSNGYGVVLTYSSESRVCTVRWFDVAEDRRSATPANDGRETELGTWGIPRLESVARGIDRNSGLIFWLDEEVECHGDGASLRVGVLKDIDGGTGELVVQEYTGARQRVRLFPCHPGIVPFSLVLTENEMMKLANHDLLEFDSQVDDEEDNSDDDDDDDDDEDEEDEEEEAMEAEAESPPEEVFAGDLRTRADWSGWRTVHSEDVAVPGDARAVDISELYEEFKEHCLGVASVFTDVSRINPMGLTFGFMELMDLGPIVVRMARATKDVRFQNAAVALKRFGASWAREVITSVSQPLLRRAWLGRVQRSPSPEEVVAVVGRLLSLIGGAAGELRTTVEALSQHYGRDFLVHEPADAQFAWPYPAALGGATAERAEPEGATAAPEEEETPIAFVAVEEFRGHHFVGEKHCATRLFLKAWKADVSLLQSSLPAGIFVKACEERMDLLSFLLIGPEETPFEDSMFHFDVWLGPDYPNKPPKVFFHSYIKERLNPNLYADGKVCLSLLGTWEGIKEGETWNPQLSNLLQIILSIQGLILNAEPFMNEPGHERTQEQQRAHYIRLYNEEVVLLSTLFTTNLLSRPPPLFLKEIKRHFRKNGDRFIKRLTEWTKAADEMEAEFKPKFSLLPVTRGFQLSMPSYIASLKKQMDAVALP